MQVPDTSTDKVIHGNTATGLYLHFPYCLRRCPFCHFTTLRYNPEGISEYIELLHGEMRLRANPETTIDSIYLGGGSPSLLRPEQLRRLMDSINSAFHILPDTEISIEANPEDLSRECLNGMIRSGFNRLSIGIQSLDSGDLDYLGRKHSGEIALDAILEAAKAGFSRINADLIIGLPTQDPGTIQQMLARLLQSSVTHLSLYLLETTPDDTRSRAVAGHQIYHDARKFLEHSGFAQYEVSSFSLFGEECRHNLKYWTNQSYLAVGISAAGFMQGVDYSNTHSLDRYRKAVNLGKTCARKRRIPLNQRRLVTGLRLTRGVCAEAFSGRWHRVKPLLEDGILVRKADRIAVAPHKMLLLNEILASYIL